MGAIELKKGIGGLTARPGSVLFGVDDSGNPVMKDENGVVTPSTTLDGSPLFLSDQVSDPAAVAGQTKLYAKDVSGASELFVRDGAGNIIQMTDGGSPAGGGGGGSAGIGTFAWKGGVVGTPYVSGDAIVGVAGEIYVVFIEGGDNLAISFPSAGAGTENQLIGFVNEYVLGATPPGGGEILLSPSAGDRISFQVADGDVQVGPLTGAVFQSDGNGRWEPVVLTSYLGGALTPA